MEMSELESAIQKELAMGRYPIMVNATAGTTVLGAIDDLNAAADLCRKYGIWMHVDVNYLLNFR